MHETTPTETGRTTVEWQRLPTDDLGPPIVRRVPYLELKLEHSDLDPTGYSEQFYPDAVPYDLADSRRVFYWRPALSSSSSSRSNWELACATTHGLAGTDTFPTTPPALMVHDTTETIVVVDGTVGGDATTARLRLYSSPSVSLDAVTESAVHLSIDGSRHRVGSGDRLRVELDERHVQTVESTATSTSTTPELVARYPGKREIHHPAPGATYRLFPSFGLDLEEMANPVQVPTTAGELDDASLAGELGIDLTARPYPERVLWQAFAYTAFDPHAETTPEITQERTGHILLRRDTSSSEQRTR